MKTKTSQNNIFNLIKDDNIFDITRERINAGAAGCSVIIPHICNNVNAFGAGFAGQVANIYPEVKANFHILGQQAKLGHTQFITVKENKQYRHSITFANMIAQNKLISHNNKRPLNYGALVYCMNQVKLYVKDLQKQKDGCSIEIHAPKFGSGLAGGDWNFITCLINDIWHDMNVFIYANK
jgi:hypothetical protein